MAFFGLFVLVLTRAVLLFEMTNAGMATSAKLLLNCTLMIWNLELMKHETILLRPSVYL